MFRSLIVAVADAVDVSLVVVTFSAALSPPCDIPGLIKYNVSKIMQPRRLNTGDRRGSMIQ